MLFFIDVDESHHEAIGKGIMTELGSIGYNVLETKHVHATTHGSLHNVIIRSQTASFEEPVHIKRSFTLMATSSKSNPNMMTS